MARLRRSTQIPTPIAAKATKPATTPPAIAPAFDDFFLSPPWPVGVPVETTIIDVEPEPEEVLESETVEGTGASTSGKPPAAFAVTGSNLSPT